MTERDPYIINTLEEMSLPVDVRMAQEMRLKAIIDDDARLSDAFAKGYEEGIEIGKKKVAREVAQSLLAANYDIQLIQKITNLTLAEIQQLKQHM